MDLLNPGPDFLIKEYNALKCINLLLTSYLQFFIYRFSCLLFDHVFFSGTLVVTPTGH